MSETWYTKTYADTRQAPSLKMHDAVLAAMALHGTRQTAVFSILDLRTGAETWYFSPDAEIAAKAFGAVPCEKPTPVPGLAFSVGAANAWEEHFPGFQPSRR